MNISRWLKDLREKMVADPLPPEKVAAGWALGMFVGCSIPFGMQLVISVPLAAMMRVSKIGASVGTLITNPVTIFFRPGLIRNQKNLIPDSFRPFKPLCSQMNICLQFNPVYRFIR